VRYALVRRNVRTAEIYFATAAAKMSVECCGSLVNDSADEKSTRRSKKQKHGAIGLKVWFGAKNGDCALQHVGEKILWLLAVRYKMWERKRSFPGLICIYGRNSRPFRMRILLRWVFASGGHCASKRVHCRRGMEIFSNVCIKTCISALFGPAYLC
jgi:hypothetical protein